MSPAAQIALWADQIRDMTAMGLHFSRNSHDRENYTRLQQMAMEMMALATGDEMAAIEPLRETIFARPTPLCAGDAAIIDGAGRIVLIQRADNGLWAMPGGAIAVGETPAAAVVREAWEEAGVRCEAAQLAAVHDSRLCGSLTRYHLYHFLFLCRPLDPETSLAPAKHPQEVLDARWVAEAELDALPLDPGHASRIPVAYAAWRGELRTYFD
jgi:8-oxo-dGTP pyrophosphatase MutT (NUDIX family)